MIDSGHQSVYTVDDQIGLNRIETACGRAGAKGVTRRRVSDSLGCREELGEMGQGDRFLRKLSLGAPLLDDRPDRCPSFPLRFWKEDFSSTTFTSFVDLWPFGPIEGSSPHTPSDVLGLSLILVSNALRWRIHFSLLIMV